MNELKERIGLDRMVVTNFIIVKLDYRKLESHVNVEVEKKEEGCRYCLSDGKGFSKLKIEDYRRFGVLSAGTSRNKYGMHLYSRMEVTIGEKPTGNLQNMTVMEYKTRIREIFGYLHTEYGVETRWDEVTISLLEINCTFSINAEFYRYHRVFRLMMYNLPAYYKKITEVRNRNQEENRLESETYYRGNDSLQIKLYDKRKQLQETYHYEYGENLLRIEFVLKRAQKVREVFKSNRLKDLTDDKIYSFFWRQFEKLFIKRYISWKRQNESVLKKMILKHKLEYGNQWAGSLLNYCRNQEQQTGIPVLLSIEDLFHILKPMDQYGHFSRTKQSLLRKCGEQDVYLQNDSQKIREIFSKIETICLANKKEQLQNDCFDPDTGEILEDVFATIENLFEKKAQEKSLQNNNR